MPYPAQVSRDRILHVAGELVEQGDIDAMTLAQLAQTLTIKPPSLYRYFPNKAALIDALNLETIQHLTSIQTAEPLDESSKQSVIITFSRRYRAYALAHPRRYQLAFRGTSTDPAVQAMYLHMALPLQEAVSHLVNDGDSLTHLRGLWALIHGFIALELAQMFQRGGNLDSAYEEAVQAYLRGIAAAQA